MTVPLPTALVPRPVRRRLRPVIRVLVPAAGVAGATVLVRRRRRAPSVDPCAPEGLALPEGADGVVTTADGAELAVRTAGPDGGPLVVLVHCWTGAKELWGPVARRLVGDGYRVVLYDQRGHGASSWGDGLPHIDRLGDDLAAVLAHVDARDAVVVGHSMGGMSIQAYVGRHGEDAHARLRAAVLAATAARTFGREFPPALAERILGDLAPSWTRTGRVGTALARGSLGPGAVRAHAVAVRDLLHATPGAARVGCLLAMARMDLRAGLVAVRLPATVLVGTHDLLTPRRSARAIVAAWPGATMRVLPGAGHMLPIERPDDIVEAIRDAVDRADALTPPCPDDGSVAKEPSDVVELTRAARTH
ncbi:MAG TPA: alpha/beta hydrolase [Acidimicrobiales bacterium]|nr:alpha/beta hydrolase [Acidimicrobiales bacterium]